MGFYQLKKTQIIKTSISAVWDFISNPKNLKLITPDYMGFDIISKNLPSRMYQGMIISYKIAPVLGIKTTWVTEITSLKEHSYFIDEQKVGPYSFWHHQHILESVKEGTLMKDVVSYKPPFRILGDMINYVIIKKQLKEIFDYRQQALDKLFTI